MPIFDTHCDVLMKMLLDPKIDFFNEDSAIDVSFPRLRQVNAAVQCFALYLPEEIKPFQFAQVLKGIELFRQRIAVSDEVLAVYNRMDLQKAVQENKLGAILSLEGVDGLQAELSYLHLAYELGVRCMGITWNYANWAADGVLEPRNGGFTLLGRKFIKECNRLGIIMDVSHLSQKGFAELVELTQKPFIASHSNAYDICPHPRNLHNEQIQAIIALGGTIGITFVPWFVSTQQPSIDKVLHHIEHICALGGVNHIGFGSDFDGMEQKIPQLEHTGMYDNLANALYARYTQEEADGFLFQNQYRFFRENLGE